MKLLLLLSLLGLAVGQAIVSKPLEATGAGYAAAAAAADFQSKQQLAPEPEESTSNLKKIGKRSYGWSPWIWPSYGHGLYSGHGISYGHGWPSYGHGWSGHGLHSGWSVGWPIVISGHGWHGSHGWHSKW